MPDWDDLRYLLAVARAGSASAAARTLGVAQTTVSRRIAALEDELRVPLFVATATGQSLSPEGQRVLTHVERMERDALAALQALAGRGGEVAGPVCVTASEWMIQRVIGPIVGPLLARYPELELELLAEPKHLNLQRRDADIAIRPSRFEQPDVVQREVATIGFGLYASDAYLASHGAPDFERQGEGHDLIAMSASLGKVPDVDWLPTIAARARVVARLNAREPMATMAAAGVGFTCLPRFVGDATPGLRLLQTPGAPPSRKLWLGVHRDARSVKRVRATADFLAERFSHLQAALCPDSPGDGR
ncbi:MAG TPA: LysR family transcriptional regulator [Polyangiaceae bacterium]|nr:LysR family transcriptional regulator [Polyangiaceae bacterium]